METRIAAINFIKSLSKTEKEHLKDMLSHGVICGADFARRSEIDPAAFSEELRLVFGGK